MLAALAHRTGDLGLAEDAVQEAMLAAAAQWPVEGLPDDPAAWLVRVASRRVVDEHRAAVSRAARERRDLERTPEHARTTPGAEESVLEAAPTADDTLRLLVMCCHPALSAASQVALTLRSVVGLTTAEVARGLLVPEATAAQRISRAKRTLREDPRPFSTLHGDSPDEARTRIDAVLHVLYLVFTEGHVATSGDDLTRPDLSARALALAREVHEARPDDHAAGGLVALMLLTEARRGARVDAGGELVPLDEQDRTRWDDDLLREGFDLVSRVLLAAPPGPYALQAAIAAVHAEARSAEDTDWEQVVGLYDLLLRVDPGPMARLGRAVAVSRAYGAAAGLDALVALEPDARVRDHHRFLAVRGQLRAEVGDVDGARADLLAAAATTGSAPERAHLQRLVETLGPGGVTPAGPGPRPGA